MEVANLLDEDGVRTCYVLDPLSVHWGGRKSSKIHRMASLECFADLTNRLEATYPRALSGAWVDDDNWSLEVIDLGARRWDDPEQRIVDRGSASPRITNSVS
jgi:hypothetical protein